MLCVKIENGDTKYLVSQRLKHPYYGFYGFITGKISWGETILETAARELMEETGLSADLMISGTEHKMDYLKDKELQEDKYFFVVRGDNPKGKVIKRFKGGRNIWLTEKEILALPNIFDDMADLIKIVNAKHLSLIENKFVVKKF